MDNVLTPMDDIVVMTITKCTAYLPRKLSCRGLIEASAAYDVVKQLASIDVFEEQVIIMLMNDHLAHATDPGMVEEH